MLFMTCHAGYFMIIINNKIWILICVANAWTLLYSERPRWRVTCPTAQVWGYLEKAITNLPSCWITSKLSSIVVLSAPESWQVVKWHNIIRIIWIRHFITYFVTRITCFNLKHQMCPLFELWDAESVQLSIFILSGLMLISQLVVSTL